MTDEQKYIELLKELGELIMQKNIYINTREYRIESLQRLLDSAEKEIEVLKGNKENGNDI